MIYQQLHDTIQQRNIEQLEQYLAQKKTKDFFLSTDLSAVIQRYRLLIKATLVGNRYILSRLLNAISLTPPDYKSVKFRPNRVVTKFEWAFGAILYDMKGAESYYLPGSRHYTELFVLAILMGRVRRTHQLLGVFQEKEFQAPRYAALLHLGLYVAVLHGKMNMMRYFVENCHIKMPAFFTETSFLVQVIQGRSVKDSASKKISALWLAAGTCLPVFQYVAGLLEITKKQDLNPICPHSNCSALFIAVQEGVLDVVEYLLDDLNAHDFSDAIFANADEAVFYLALLYKHRLMLGYFLSRHDGLLSMIAEQLSVWVEQTELLPFDIAYAVILRHLLPLYENPDVHVYQAALQQLLEELQTTQNMPQPLLLEAMCDVLKMLDSSVHLKLMWQVRSFEVVQLLTQLHTTFAQYPAIQQASAKSIRLVQNKQSLRSLCMFSLHRAVYTPAQNPPSAELMTKYQGLPVHIRAEAAEKRFAFN